MPFNQSDPVYACFRVINPLTLGQINTAERLHRVLIATPGEWNIGDTFKIKDASLLFFGYQDAADLLDEVIVQDVNNNVVPCSMTGLGTNEITVTLSGSAPNNSTLTVCYRVGIPSTYVECLLDRGIEQINCHSVTLDAVTTYQTAFNQVHPLTKTGDGVIGNVLLDGMSIQTNPPA